MKLKKWLLGLVTFAAMVVLCAVCAGAETYGDFEYSVLDDGTVKITDYNGSAEKVDIPKMIDGKSVTSIKYNAFRGCTSLKSITIPNSVMSIGSSAFRGCTSLTSITIPNSVTSIESDAFGGCTSLTAINVATRNQNYVSVNGVLYDKNKTVIIRYPAGKKDKSYSILDSVMGIFQYAFEDCANLESITLPDSVTIIGLSAFNDCTSLTTINVATGNQKFVSVNGVLYDKDKTTIIRYPAGKKDKNYNIFNTAKYIENDSFGDCTNLVSVTIPNSVEGIGDNAFSGCTSLTSITLPGSVTYIGNNAFSGCTSIRSITIPNSVKGIGNNAFSGCSIKSIIIPNSVTSIFPSSFDGCTSLTAINVAAGNRYYVSVNGVLYNKNKTTIIRYPEGKKDKSYSILDSVTCIDSHAFDSCTNLTSITIPNSVTSIDSYTFGGCISLTSIVIPKSVTSISFLALLGYYYDNGYNQIDNFKIKQIDNFKIYCYSGTAGEKYAKDNRFNYELITAEKPAKVTNFKVKSKTSTAVTMQWNKNTSASGYQLQQYKDGKWVTIYTGTKATDTSYTVKKLKAGTAGYRFRIRAYKTYGNTKQYGSWSSEVKVNTNPYGVGGFKCSSKSSTSVTLKWNKGTTASGYQLQQYKNGKWVTIYTGTKATNTSYTVKNLKAGTAGYRFRIRAYKTYGNTKQYGSWSSEVKVNTNPYGVGGFKAKSTAKTSITLGWNKGTTASGYQLQQYKGGKWVTVYTGTKATSTSYTVKSLKANTSYKFRIRAYKTYGSTKQYGSWSSELTVRTKR